MPSTTLTLSSTEGGSAATKIAYDKISTTLRARRIGHTVSESKRYFYTGSGQNITENIEYSWRWDFPSNTSTTPV
jgi:hypothetical protein